MKALGNKVLRKKVEIETEKYMKENYQELAYHAICGQAPVIMQQTEAAVLYALSLHGYGAKQLKEFHDWYCQIMNFPEIMGKTPKLIDVMQVMRERYDIDFDRVCPKFPTFEQYKRSDDGKT